MGLSIDPIGATGVAYSPRLPTAVLLTEASGSAVELQAPRAGANAALLGQRDQADIAKVGFGDGTISSAGAALRALDGTIRASRTMLESLEEVRQRIRVGSSKGGRGVSQSLPLDQASPDATSIQLNPYQATAARQARNFINTLDQAAGVAQARINGETPPAPSSGQEQRAQATFEVNGQTFTATLAPGAPRINLLA